jgi:hypothetical protein
MIAQYQVDKLRSRLSERINGFGSGLACCQVTL